MPVRESKRPCPSRPMAPKLAAIAAAVPPLEPAVTRLESHELRVYPGRMELTVSLGESELGHVGLAPSRRRHRAGA